MSESFVDRILVGQSLDGNGPLTRSLNEAQTSGYIRSDAPHWSIETYIPLSPASLIDYLVSRGEMKPGHVRPFRQCCADLDKILQKRSASYQSQFSDAYAAIDPDADQRQPIALRHSTRTQVDHSQSAFGAGDRQTQAVHGESSESLLAAEGVLEERVERLVLLCDEILTEAGFRRLKFDEISRCVGVVSQFGVPLHVDLAIFQRLVVYARGDVIGSRVRRRLRSLYRRESVEVQVYQRMVLIFQLRDDDDSDEGLAASAVHLRMFKNIPKQDVDTLLPCTRVRISGIDRLKIIVPSLGGFLMSLRRIAQTAFLFAMITLHWSAILVALLIGYLVKSVLSYFQTKNRYQLNLTRNLYFQKLDSNAGVGYHAIHMGHQQLLMEAILAQYAVVTGDQALSERRLRRKCERLIREASNVEVDFQVERALQSLVKVGSVRPADDAWIAEPSMFL